MIKYRKNENWDSLSFVETSYSYVDKRIKREISNINFDKENFYIDVIDISIRSVALSQNNVSHYVTIFYAIIPLDYKEIKVNI